MEEHRSVGKIGRTPLEKNAVLMLSENIRQFGMKSILPRLSNRAISVNFPRKENNLFRWGTLSDHCLCSGTISSWSRPRCIKMLIWQTCQKWKTKTTIAMCSTWSWSWRFNWSRMQQHKQWWVCRICDSSASWAALITGMRLNTMQGDGYDP